VRGASYQKENGINSIEHFPIRLVEDEIGRVGFTAIRQPFTSEDDAVSSRGSAKNNVKFLMRFLTY
jgi:hypothetical protein